MPLIFALGFFGLWVLLLDLKTVDALVLHELHPFYSSLFWWRLCSRIVPWRHFHSIQILVVARSNLSSWSIQTWHTYDWYVFRYTLFVVTLFHPSSYDDISECILPIFPPHRNGLQITWSEGLARVGVDWWLVSDVWEKRVDTPDSCGFLWTTKIISIWPTTHETQRVGTPYGAPLIPPYKLDRSNHSSEVANIPKAVYWRIWEFFLLISYLSGNLSRPFQWKNYKPFQMSAFFHQIIRSLLNAQQMFLPVKLWGFWASLATVGVPCWRACR